MGAFNFDDKTNGELEGLVERFTAVGFKKDVGFSYSPPGFILQKKVDGAYVTMAPHILTNSYGDVIHSQLSIDININRPECSGHSVNVGAYGLKLSASVQCAEEAIQELLAAFNAIQERRKGASNDSGSKVQSS